MRLGDLQAFAHVKLSCVRLDAKKNVGKTKGKQLSKDMIGLPQADFIHAFHIGVSGIDKNYRLPRTKPIDWRTFL